MKKAIMMNIAELQHPEKNVRNHSQKQIKEMKRSLEKFGQFRDIVVDENNVILCGNGLVMAMRDMGWTEAKVLKYDNLSDKDKKKLMIADNQIASLGTDNFSVIEEFIKSLDGDLDVPGYDEEMIKTLVLDDEELEAEVMKYGSFSTEQIDAVKSNEGVQREPVEQTYKPTESRQAVDSWQSGAPAGNQYMPPEEPMQASKAETQRYVICPHCGEKIYLE